MSLCSRLQSLSLSFLILSTSQFFSYYYLIHLMGIVRKRFYFKIFLFQLTLHMINRFIHNDAQIKWCLLSYSQFKMSSFPMMRYFTVKYGSTQAETRYEFDYINKYNVAPDWVNILQVYQTELFISLLKNLLFLGQIIYHQRKAYRNVSFTIGMLVNRLIVG